MANVHASPSWRTVIVNPRNHDGRLLLIRAAPSAASRCPTPALGPGYQLSPALLQALWWDWGEFTARDDANAAELVNPRPTPFTSSHIFVFT